MDDYRDQNKESMPVGYGGNNQRQDTYYNDNGSSTTQQPWIEDRFSQMNPQDRANINPENSLLRSGQPPNNTFVPVSGMLSPSLEDKMILRQISKESFWYRCVPLTLASTAFLYYYNEKRKVPHGLAKYACVGLMAFIVGKVSYVKTAQYKLLESSSNSEFVRELRKKTPSYLRRHAGDKELNSDYESNYFDTSSKDWADPISSEFTPDDVILDPNQPSTIHQQSQAPQLTYDELRARNREIYERTSRRN